MWATSAGDSDRHSNQNWGVKMYVLSLHVDMLFLRTTISPKIKLNGPSFVLVETRQQGPMAPQNLQETSIERLQIICTCSIFA